MAIGDPTATLEADIAAYEAMREDLEAHHKGKWVLIHNGDLIDTFDNFDAAATEAVRRFGRGPYLLREVAAPKLILPASVMFRPVYSDAAG